MTFAFPFWRPTSGSVKQKPLGAEKGDSPLLGVHGERAYALLYNGVLGDKRPNGGNVLTRPTLKVIREKIAELHPRFAQETPAYPLTVYGERSRLTAATLKREGITFKLTPYDVKARG